MERIAVSLMYNGRNSGKKLMAMRIVRSAMDIIHLLTDQNPLQIVVNAIINSGPREDSTRVGSAGVVRRQAVDMSPFRRVNYAIYLLVTGCREASFRNIKTIAECLADERRHRVAARLDPPARAQEDKLDGRRQLDAEAARRVGADLGGRDPIAGVDDDAPVRELA